MRKLLLVLGVFLFTSMSFAQDASMVPGDWVYKGIADQKQLDEIGEEMAQQFFGDMAFTFNKDNSFVAKMRGQEIKGEWVILKEGETQPADDPNKKIVYISKTSQEVLTMKIGQGAILMQRKKS